MARRTLCGATQTKSDFPESQDPTSLCTAPLHTGQCSCEHFTLEELEFFGVLGSGGQGVVKLAIDKSTEKAVAVKEIYKSCLTNAKSVLRVFREKTILASAKHPFIVDFYGTCQDKRKLYLLMEFVMGGEVYSLLGAQKKLTSAAVHFYAAEVTAVFMYLHSQGFVYRDLKPENVLLATSGHIKLADFGCAKRLKFGERTFSLCGTPEYMAPEVLSRHGHSLSVDWWALGIFIHELLTGQTPFTGQTPAEVYSNILTQPYTPPEVDDHTKSLLEGLLNKDPSLRLTEHKVKNHPYFAHIDWDQLENRQPPYIPEESIEFCEDFETDFDGIETISQEYQAAFRNY